MSGAAVRAPCNDSGRNDVNSGGMALPCHRRAASRATTSPVCCSTPGVGLISTLRKYELRRQKRATLSSVGRGSPAHARECQLPASSRDSELHGCSPATALAPAPSNSRPLVVRSSVLSCIRKGTPSADSFASHSNMR